MMLSLFPAVLSCILLLTPLTARAQIDNVGADAQQENAVPDDLTPEEEQIEPTEDEDPLASPLQRPLPLATDVEKPASPKSTTVSLDAVVTLNYAFAGSTDKFAVKYSLHAEGRAAGAQSVIRGNAEITARVEGLLAKWPTGQCALEVTAEKVPYTMQLRRSGDTRLSVTVRLNGTIAENWRSLCTFEDTPEASFNTSGDPEKWLTEALKKTSPSLNALSLDLNPDDSTSISFAVTKQTIDDKPLGTITIDGTGVLTVTPSGQAE